MHNQGFELETTDKKIQLLVKVELEPKIVRLRIRPLDKQRCLLGTHKVEVN